MRVRLAAVVAGLLLAAHAPASLAAPAPAPTYLILPFENIAEEPSLVWLSGCLAFSVGEYLTGLGAGVIEDEERAVLFEGSGLPAGAPLMLASAIELGRKMRSRATHRPDRMVLGRFLVTEGSLTISARSVDLESEKARPWATREGRLTDLLSLQNRVTLDLAEGDGLEIRASRTALLQKHSGEVPLLAFETYCRSMSEPDPKERLRGLRRAVRESPGYPKAIYQALRLLVRAERWGEAATLIEEIASEPHPYEADYHLLAAQVAIEQGEPEKAGGAAKRSLEYAESSLGHLLLARVHIENGDWDAARAELAAAEALDPSAPGLDELRRLLAQNPSG